MGMAAIFLMYCFNSTEYQNLGHVTEAFASIFVSFALRSLHTKFENNWPNDSWEYLYIIGNAICVTSAETANL